MIEEELSPIYTPVDVGEQQEPELPQRMGDPLGDVIAQPAIEQAASEQAKFIQDELDKKQSEINLRRSKDKMIRSEILGSEDHTDEDKMRLMREWVTNTTGEVPKSYGQFEMGLDKAWKASGRGGIAPDYRSAFDAVRGKLQEDEQKRKLDESYFNKGTKSIFAPELYSIDRSFAQQDVTPEERRILSEMYDQGAKAQVARYGEKMITDIKMVMDTLDQGMEPADVIDSIVEHTREMSSEEKGLFVSGLREAMIANPSPKVESFLNNAGLAIKGGAITLGMIPNWLRKEAAAANINLARYQQQLSTEHSTLRMSPTGGLIQNWFDRDKEQTGIAADAVDNYKDVVHDADMKMELRYLFGKEYDPIVPLAREGSMLRLMEEGLYGVPSVGASIAVVAAPMIVSRFMPMAGLKGSVASLGGVAGFALSASEIEENKRQGFLRGGAGFDEASLKADEFSTYAQALPHYMIERFQVGSLLGKTKVTKALYNKLNSTLRNRGARLASKFAGQVLMQTAEEVTQDLYSNMVNDMISAFDEEMGEVDWNDVFDGFWAKSAVTMFSLSPFAATSAAGGFSAEERAAAWAKLPPLMLQSYGYRQSDIDYVDQAASPAERVERVAEAEANRDQYSEEAKDATQIVAEAAMRQQQAIEDLKSAGQFPAMNVTFAEGRPNIKVQDPETGETILETDNYGEATETAFNWVERKADADSAEFMYLNTMLRAAGRMAQDSPASQQILELGNTMTKAKMIAENEESAQRIREQSERNEQIYGGEAKMTELIFGSNVVGVDEAGQTKVINRLFEGASITTLIHETGHAKFKEGLQKGTINYDEVVRTLKRIDKALVGKKTKEIKHGKKVRQSEDLSFLKGVESPSFTQVDEAMAELWEAMILGEGRMGSMREIIKDSMFAYAKSGEGSQLRNFISALRYYFNLAMSRVFAMKKAVRDGEIDQKDIDKLRAMMQGTTVQEELEADAQREFDETIRPALEEESFALEPDPYRDRVGEDQGKPLTQTEIEEGIEDESGTLADVEVDGDKLADIGFEEGEASFSMAEGWRTLKPEDVRGKRLFGFYADRMRVGTYTGLDPESGISIECQGGIDYPLAHEGAAWAVSNDSMHSAIANAADARDGIAVVFAYQTGNITGNETFALAYTEELKWAVKSGKISEERALEILNKVREEAISLYETLQRREQKKADAKAEREGKDPVKKALAPWAIKNKDAWKSLDEFFASLLKENGGTFDSRGDKMFRTGLDVKGLVTAQKLGANNYVKEGMPDITKMVKLLEVDNSSDINTGDVLGLVEIDKGQAGNAVSAEDIGVQPHRSYSKVITGRAYGKLPKRVNVLDFFDPRKGALPLAGEVLKMKEEARVAELEEVSFSISPAQDAAYMSAVESGNMETAQSMVDAVAYDAGYRETGYHGGAPDIEVFDRKASGRTNTLDTMGTWFSTEKNQVGIYHHDPQIYKAHIKLDTPLLYINQLEALEAKGQPERIQKKIDELGGDLEKVNEQLGEYDRNGKWQTDEANQAKEVAKGIRDSIAKLKAEKDQAQESYDRNEPFQRMVDDYRNFVGGRTGDTDAYIDHLKSQGYDGIKLVDTTADTEVNDGTRSDIADWFVVFDANQIKSADPVTYDSDGNVIPLSQRFDPSRDEISFSMGVPYKSILGSAQRRIKSPEVKVSMLGDVQRRVQKLITDSNRLKIKDDFKEERMMKSLRKEGAMRQALRRDELEKEGMQPAEARRQAIEETDKWLNQEILDIEKNQRKRVRDMLVTYEAILLALPTNIRGKMGSAVKLVDVRTEEQILKFFDKKLDKLEKVVDSWISKNFDRSAKKLFDRALAKKVAGKKDKGRLGAAIHRIFDAADKARFELDDEAKVDGAVAEIEATINSKMSADQLTPEEENELETKLNMVQLFGNWRNLDNADKEAALKYGWREFEYAFLMSKIRKAEEREDMERKANELIAATGIPVEKIEEEADKRREGYGKWFGRIKATSYNFWDFEQVLSSVFPDAKQVIDKVIQEQQADATFNDRMREHQEGIENLFASLAGDDLFGVKALKLQDKMQSMFFEVSGGGIKRQLTQMEMIQARLMWRQEDGRRHMENWDKEDKRNYSQEFMDSLEKQMTPEAFAVEDYLIAEYEKEYDRLNEIHERVNGVSLPRNNMYSPLTVSPLQSLKNDQIADPITGQAVDSIDGSNPSLLRRSKTAAAKPVFRDALRTFYAHKNQVEYWMAYAEFLKELRSLMGNRDIRDAAEARGGQEALTMLQKWVDVLSNHGIKTSALSSQFNSFISRSTNRAASAILAGRLSVLAIQSTQIGAALAQMPTKDYVWRLGKLLSGQLNYKEAFNSDFIQRRIKQAPPAVRMAMEGMASGKPNIAKAAAEKMGTLIAGADAFFTSGTYAIIYDYLTTKKGMASAEAHTEAARLTEQVAQPTRMARRSMIEIQQSKIAIAKLSWAFASETRQKIALAAYRFAHAKSWQEKARAMAVTWGFGGAFASIVRAVSADLRDDDDEEIFDEKYWNPTRMVLQSLLPPLTGIPVYGEMAEIGLMKAAKLAGLETGYIFDGDSMISSVKDFPKTAFNLYGTSRDVIGGDEEAEKLIKDIDKLLISIAPLFDTAAAASSFSHVVRDLFMLGKNIID